MALFRRQRKLRLTKYLPYTHRNVQGPSINLHSRANHVEPAKVIVDSLSWTTGTKQSGSTFTVKVEMPGNGRSVAKLDRALAKLLDDKSKLQIVDGVFYAVSDRQLFGKITFMVV